MSLAEVRGAASAPGLSVRTPIGQRTPDAPRTGAAAPATYAALDLGTNNCRLLIARPAQHGFRIVDAFSRIVRLGEGMTLSGRLSEAAMDRTLAALEVCRSKMKARGVTRARLIATEACRIAANGHEFVRRVRESTGLELEIVDRETEAHLAAGGCASLADPQARGVLLFDIGGGSSEIVWLGPERKTAIRATHSLVERERVRAWDSLQIGVVTLAEQFGGVDVDDAAFERMVEHVSESLSRFVSKVERQPRCGRFHLLGTSGTVTTIAGVHLDLPRYDRRQVDGLWMSADEMDDALARLRAMPYEARAAHGCIGSDRADLVLAGCAILEAIRLAFPSERIRIADRGLREGILMQLMNADRVWSTGGPAARA